MVQEVRPLHLARRVEALLFAAGDVVSSRRLADVLGVSEEKVEAAIATLQGMLAERASALQVERVAGGWRLVTREEFDRDITNLLSRKRKGLSRAALETLAVVAYKQPIKRSDIEAIRGAPCGEALRQLREAGLVRIAGREEGRGKALLYATTRKFLQTLGLASINELPDPETLKQEIE